MIEKKSDSYFSKPILIIEILNLPVSEVLIMKFPFSSDDVLILVQLPCSSRSRMSAYGIPMSESSVIFPEIKLWE